MELVTLLANMAVKFVSLLSLVVTLVVYGVSDFAC